MSNQSSPDEHVPKQDSLTNLGPTEYKQHQDTETPLSHSKTLQSLPHNEEAIHSNDGALERIPTAQDDLPDPIVAELTATDGVPYTIFTRHQRAFIVFMASWAGFFSPVSGQIYFPALNVLAKDLKVSNTLINLTLTSYMVCCMPSCCDLKPRLTMTSCRYFKAL